MFIRASEESLQGRSDCSRHDGGQNADVNSDLPPEYLKDLMMAFYNTQVTVHKQKSNEIKLLTRNQGSDECSTHIWMAHCCFTRTLLRLIRCARAYYGMQS